MHFFLDEARTFGLNYFCHIASWFDLVMLINFSLPLSYLAAEFSFLL